MARDDSPPWARGETFYNQSGSPVNPPINYQGREYLFEVNSPEGYLQNDPSGRQIRVKVAANLSGANLLPGKIARWKASNAPQECVVDGYFSAAADIPAGVVDEFLPPGGVANGDYFFLVIDGPTSVLTVPTGLTALAIGDRIEAAPGTGPLTADSGNVNKFAATPTVEDLLQRVGRSEQVQAAGNALTKAVVHFLPIR